MYFKSDAITMTDNTYAYRGHGYQYFLHTASKMGTYAKLRINKATFAAFRALMEKAPKVFCKGQLVQSLTPKMDSLKGLEIMSTGNGGWYTLTVLDETMGHMVTKFLARLNQYMLRLRRNEHTQHLQVITNNSLHKVYQVVARAKNGNRPGPLPTSFPVQQQARPQVQRQKTPAYKQQVAPSKLQQLVTTVNARFGHV